MMAARGDGAVSISSVSSKSLTGGSGQRWPASDPRPRGLERGRGAEHRRVVEAAADDLKPDRQAIAGEAARHGSRRLAREIERIREDAGGLALDLHAPDLGWIEDAVAERRCRDRRREKQIEALEELHR